MPLALTAAGSLTYGLFGAGTQPKASAATAVPAWATATADGFASVDALGQKGTYGGRGGRIVIVKTLADLEKYATATDPYIIVVAAAIDMDPVGMGIKVQSNKTIIGSGTSGQIVGGGSFLGQGVHNVIIRNLTIRDAYQGEWHTRTSTTTSTATLVQRGNLFSGTSGRNESGGTGASWDPKSYYGYTLDKAADVPALLKTGAGPRSSLGTSNSTKAAATTLTVAQDGSGQYRTVQAAVNAVPANNPSRVVIAVKPGTYRETVKVPADKPHVTIQGTGGSRKDTVIVYNNAAGTRKPDGSGTYGTGGSATVTLLLDTAAKEKLGRVYMTNSYVVGNVDFVFGRATAVLDKSVITLKKRWDGTSAGFVTAPSTPANRKGFLIANSTVGGSVSDRSFFLGRPWHAGGDATLDPQTTVRNTTLSRAVKAAPWTDMSGFSWKDDRFAEYKNSGAGAGAASADRPQLTDAQAAQQEVADWLGNWSPAAS
ncbi:pectinesterase family protein [Streptomyces sp. NPDC058755]|uniref:pectinesterase family protein n=1 Tax=Streptomyces sp. NPDC058755 TaxID=3346624 RepID=UPI0036A2E4AA